MSEIRCPVCLDTVQSHSELYGAHKKVCKGEPERRCNKCQQVFKAEKALKDHVCPVKVKEAEDARSHADREEAQRGKQRQVRFAQRLQQIRQKEVLTELQVLPDWKCKNKGNLILLETVKENAGSCTIFSVRDVVHLERESGDKEHFILVSYSSGKQVLALFNDRSMTEFEDVWSKFLYVMKCE